MFNTHNMSDSTVKNIIEMINPHTFIDGSKRSVIKLPSIIIGKGVYKPGWQWSKHAGPQTGKTSAHHIGLIESGSMIIKSPDGSETIINEGDAFEIKPGHDAWVTGNQPCIALDFETQV